VSDNQDVVLVGDFYKKRKKIEKIVMLADGSVMLEKNYEKFVDNWHQSNIMQPPVAIKSRKTEIVTIDRQVIVENDILEEEETDFSFLPLVFVDGNSIKFRQEMNGPFQQVTRPMVYHAEGVQKLKNFAGITLANELENMVQHKFMVPKEAIPPEYKEAYINVQTASVLVYNSFMDDNAQIPINAPQPVPRVPCPPEVTNTFRMTDEVTQAILGTYDAALGINNNQLSGEAIQQGAMHSNTAAMPYIVGYLKAYNRAAEMILDLIPKYYDTPRSIPIRSIDGKSKHVSINGAGNPMMQYDSGAFNIKIEAGVNFEIQKARSLQMLTMLMKTSPFLAEYLGGTKEGIETLLDNIDIRNIDALKQGVAKFVQEKQQQQKQMQQMQMMTNPAMVKLQEIKQKQQSDQMDAENKAARTNVEKQEADTNRLLALAEIGQSVDKATLERDKIQAEQARTAVSELNAHINMADTAHKHAMDLLELHHTNQKDLGAESYNPS
jgi:hypothetical protein